MSGNETSLSNTIATCPIHSKCKKGTYRLQSNEARKELLMSPVAAGPEVLSGFVEEFHRRWEQGVVERLLVDASAMLAQESTSKQTTRNIVWATDSYREEGDGYGPCEEVSFDKICLGKSGVIKPRVAKSDEEKKSRRKKKAEVFTPSWLVCEMVNNLDEAWFDRKNVFATVSCNEDGSHRWTTSDGRIEFPTTVSSHPKASGESRGWRSYVGAQMIELACGEGPFLFSRYDTVSGRTIPVGQRVGILDRKLRVVTERTKQAKSWMNQAMRALSATYGFEYQGDNLVICRMNALETMREHMLSAAETHGWSTHEVLACLERLGNEAPEIICWNIWQMDGLCDKTPARRTGKCTTERLNAYVMNWENKSSEAPMGSPVLFSSLKDRS